VISYKDIVLQIFSYISQADYNCYRVIANFFPNFVAMATGVGGRKCDWQHSMAHPQKSRIDAKISQISHTQTEFCPKFRSMATGVDRKNAVSSIRWPIPENPPTGAKISQKSLMQAEL